MSNASAKPQLLALRPRLLLQRQFGNSSLGCQPEQFLHLLDLTGLGLCRLPAAKNLASSQKNHSHAIIAQMLGLGIVLWLSCMQMQAGVPMLQTTLPPPKRTSAMPSLHHCLAWRGTGEVLARYYWRGTTGEVLLA
eukprot:15445595-Alexandrium_andersonii.AAC.1